MHRPIITFTDFGFDGPYLGQVRIVFQREAPKASVVDLMADAPAFDPRASAYLLAALVPYLPPEAVVFAVVDPGVGGARAPMVADVDGRLFVGPANGLFEAVMRRGRDVRCWEIAWKPERLSSTFHGRDLFAPVAARLARGDAPDAVGLVPMPVPAPNDWPDDLAAVVYFDGYGNAWTGLRAPAEGVNARLRVGGAVLDAARTFGDVMPGTPFWYVNSCGLVEIAVAGGSAQAILGLSPGQAVAWESVSDNTNANRP